MANDIEELFAWLATLVSLREPDTREILDYGPEYHYLPCIAWNWRGPDVAYCRISLLPNGDIWIDAALDRHTAVQKGGLIYAKACLNETIKRLEPLISIQKDV